MASKFERLDVSEGWQTRALRDIRRKATEQRAAKRLPASDFGGVQAGAIPTDKLNQPSAPGYVNLPLVTAFAVLQAGGNITSADIPVPDGFTACVVSLAGRVLAYNPRPVKDYLLARTVVNGFTSNAFPVPAAAAGSLDNSALNIATSGTVVTNLGSTMTVSLWAQAAGGDWAIDVGNTADLTGTLVWFR